MATLVLDMPNTTRSKNALVFQIDAQTALIALATLSLVNSLSPRTTLSYSPAALKPSMSSAFVEDLKMNLEAPVPRINTTVSCRTRESISDSAIAC
jgi:hypothetical protein